MQFNGLLSYIQKHSLPFSETKVVVPSTTVCVSVDMMEEHLYNWLENCEFVKGLASSYIIEGVAHDVSIIFETDGTFELMEVE